jgi:hypothetical protein
METHIVAANRKRTTSSRPELPEDKARDFAISCAREAFIIVQQLKTASRPQLPDDFPVHIPKLAEELLHAINRDILIPSLAIRLGKARASVGPYRDGELYAVTAHEAAIKLCGDWLREVYTYQDALAVLRKQRGATGLVRSPDFAKQWLRDFKVDDIVSAREQVMRLMTEIEWEFRQIAPEQGKAKGPNEEDLQPTREHIRHLGIVYIKSANGML